MLNNVTKEWFKQAVYDLKTATAMFKTRRYIHSVFMCHLSLEKAFKGLYFKKFNDYPPKLHNLLYFVEKINIKLSDDLYQFIFRLNRASIPTRYPDDLMKLLKIYDKKTTGDIVKKTRKVLECLRKEL